jgi:hypothetical protein
MFLNFIVMCTCILTKGGSSESYKLEDKCCKESYIGDYAVINCQYYGNYCECKGEEWDKNLKIGYDKKSDAVLLIKGKEVIIGELQLSDSEKKIFKPYFNLDDELNKNPYYSLLYTCRISQNDEKVKINDRLRVTVWVKKLNKEINENNNADEASEVHENGSTKTTGSNNENGGNDVNNNG